MEPSEWIALISAISTLLLVVIAFFQDKIKLLWQKPKLEISFDMDSADAVIMPMKNSQTGEIIGNGFWIRLKITNTGNYRAENVEVYLDNLERLNEDGKYNRVDSFIPLNLLWSNLLIYEMLHINPSIPKHCDLCSMRWGKDFSKTEENRLMLETVVQPNNNGSILIPGTYRLEILLSTTNSKVSKHRIELFFTGKVSMDKSEMIKNVNVTYKKIENNHR